MDGVNEVVPQLISKGKVPRPGIGIVMLDDAFAVGLGQAGGVIDRVMPDSEADRDGLKEIDYRRRTLGDIIVVYCRSLFGGLLHSPAHKVFVGKGLQKRDQLPALLGGQLEAGYRSIGLHSGFGSGGIGAGIPGPPP